MTCSYWETDGTKNHVLRNKVLDGTQVVNEVDLLTNQNTRIRILQDGMVYVLPRSGTIGGPTSWATMHVMGGDNSSFDGVAFHKSDWGPNIQSFVNRALAKSFVVNWNGADRFYVAGQGWLYANGVWVGSSRARKTAVRRISGALEKVTKLNGVTYRHRKEKPVGSGKTRSSAAIERRAEIGLIAEDYEKEKVSPEELYLGWRELVLPSKEIDKFFKSKKLAAVCGASDLNN